VVLASAVKGRFGLGVSAQDVSACNFVNNGRFGLHLGNGCRSAGCIAEVVNIAGP